MQCVIHLLVPVGYANAQRNLRKENTHGNRVGRNLIIALHQALLHAEIISRRTTREKNPSKF
jgi:hypothetical protein